MHISQKTLASLVLIAVSVVMFASFRAGAQQATEAEKTQDAKAPTSMARSAQSAFESTAAAYDAGTTTVECVYRWSKRWMESEKSPSVASHLARMQELHERIAAKYRAGAPGGEAENFHATAYYVAEAKAIASRKQ